jgi:hypothetical protein
MSASGKLYTDIYTDIDLVPYQSPVNPKYFFRLSFNLLFVGFILLSWFIM